VSSLPPGSNPFATRYTRPGVLRFRFPPGENESTLVERLRLSHWRGQIVGPHGSGKSSLLAALAPALEAAGRSTRTVALHEGDRRLKLARREWSELSACSLLIIDGYEQLGRLARWSVDARCRRRGCGLLVTTHRDVGLPLLFTTRSHVDLAIELAHELLPSGQQVIRDADIEAAWGNRRGNMREMLFDLYDLFELRRPASG
jgi:energy-coupling factor transporter ATP-binding protein EcfA2